jgi:integrase
LAGCSLKGVGDTRLEAAFQRAGVKDISSHDLRKKCATRLLSRGAAITDVQHLLGHSSEKITETADAAFVKNERSRPANSGLRG